MIIPRQTLLYISNINKYNKQTPNFILKFGVCFWGEVWGSNPRPSEPQSDALTN